MLKFHRALFWWGYSKQYQKLYVSFQINTQSIIVFLLKKKRRKRLWWKMFYLKTNKLKHCCGVFSLLLWSTLPPALGPLAPKICGSHWWGMQKIIQRPQRQRTRCKVSHGNRLYCELNMDRKWLIKWQKWRKRFAYAQISKVFGWDYIGAKKKDVAPDQQNLILK